MTFVRQYISKGFYQYPQISDFVSVKDYMFVRHNGKKCLMLRLVNDLGYTINTLAFTVVQMDAMGKVLDRTKLKHKNLNFAPGMTYVTSEALVVDEFCTDFRVIFTGARSESYKYTVRNGRIIIDYIKRTGDITENSQAAEPVKGFSIQERVFGRPRLGTLVATLAAILLIGLCAFEMTSNYIAQADDSETSPEESAEPEVSEALALPEFYLEQKR